MSRARTEYEINLTVPHELRPGDRYVQPHFDYEDHWLVVEVQGQRLTVVRWNWWQDRFVPRLYRLLHPELW